MFCLDCGTRIKNNICPNCGKKTEDILPSASEREGKKHISRFMLVSVLLATLVMAAAALAFAALSFGIAPSL